jgi:hypothetical protein
VFKPPYLHQVLHEEGGARSGERGAAPVGHEHHLGAAAQVERKQTLKAVYHILVSSASFQALTTWVSSFQLATPYLGHVHDKAGVDAVLGRGAVVALVGGHPGVAAQLEFESKV